MVLVVKLIEDDYWEIVSMGSIESDYTLTPGQKFIHTDTWIAGKNKQELVWNEEDAQVILYPEHLKLSQYKKKKLNECILRLSNSDHVIGESMISKIVTDIKNSSSTSEVDTAFNQLNTEKNKFLKRIGLSTK